MRFCLLFALVLSFASSAGSAEAQCAMAMPGDACDDGLFCTVDDMCDAMLNCVGTARDCSDGEQCTRDLCDEMAGACDNPPSASGTSCGDGDYCSVNDECDGRGNCMTGDPRDCSDGRSCTMDICDEAGNDCDNPLIPGNCLIGGTCRAAGAANSTGCQICDPAVSTSAWSPGPAGTPCGATTCDMAMQIDRVCDAEGACGSEMTPCEFGVCHDENFCATCSVDADCPSSTYCKATECVLAAPNGAVCDRDRRCASGQCVGGICCDSACDGPCESCGYAASLGVCVPHPAGTDPEEACGMALCDGRGQCETDAGLPPVPEEVTFQAHGSGCIACAVGAPLDSRPESALVLFLTPLLALCRVRRRR